MGSCFSKKTHTTAPSPAPQNSDHQQPHSTGNEQQAFKKEIFVIKHRVSHEIDRHSDQNPSATTSTGTGTGARSRTPSCSKEEVDAILIQCDRINRSNSAGAQNPIRRRRYSRSKRSFDLGLNTTASSVNYDDVDGDGDVDDDDDALNHRHRHRHRPPEIRVSSSSSKDRRISISPSRRRSSSKERRISISPSRRRSESPFANSNPNRSSSVAAAAISSGNRPAKMVSVPATDKSNSNNNAAGVELEHVKRIHVKRNVSPARINHGAFSDEVGHRRKSLVEIDNNAARSAQSRDTKRTRKLSRDLDNVAPSYASLLLEDIHNFHKRNTSSTSAATMSPSFALPECVSKACLIMEAVADLNSSTSSLCSDDRWRNPNPNSNPTTIEKDSSGMALAAVDNGPT